MALELEAVIYQQDPFNYGYKDYNYNIGLGAHDGFSLDQLLQEDNKPNAATLDCSTEYWDSPPSSVAWNSTSSPETCGGTPGVGFCAGGVYSPAKAPVAAASRTKRRRNKTLKNKEEMESQRMTHIAVERNRRRQMNDYLAVLRSLMPPSYAQRGDQASIVGGAINFVKELEQLLQFLEAHKLRDREQHKDGNSDIFSDFFTFPQYSMRPSTVDGAAERRSSIADIEVTMVEGHANIKILSKRRPKQLLKMVTRFQYIRLSILHLNITTVHQSTLYSFSVKVEEECQLSTANEIATAVHEMVGMIQEESTSSPDNPPQPLNYI